MKLQKKAHASKLYQDGIAQHEKGKLFSFINIAGLSTGMAVTMIIGIWVWDEVSFNRSFQNYDRIGQAWQFVTFDVDKASFNSMPVPLAEELRTKYPDIEKAASLWKLLLIGFGAQG